MIAGSSLLAAFGRPAASASDPGFFTKTYTDAAGHTSRCILFVPRERPAGRLPVILFLNGKGENGSDGLRQAGNNFGGDVWRMRGHFPFLAVCPQCPDGGHWDPHGQDAEAALVALDRAITEYGGDPDRVYVTGPSSGGVGAMELAAAYPRRFAAVVPIATPGPADLRPFAAAGVPCWAFYNRRDEASLVTAARAMRAKLLAAGRSPLVTELDQSGHNAWDAAYESPALFAWLLEQSRTKNAAAERFRLLTPEALLAGWERRGFDGWSADGDELWATLPPDEAESVLVSPVVRGDAALHFDAYLENASRSRVALFAATGHGTDRAEVVLELPAVGTGGLRSSGGGWVAPLDPAGQRALRVGWNDVRLSRERGRWRLRLNGWPALEFADPASGGPVRWGLVARDESARWRFVRHRVPSSDARGDAP